MASVLITDGLLRKSLSLTRSLGSQGLQAYTADRTRFTPSAFSKYSAGAWVHPDPVEQPEAYAQWMFKTLASQRFDLLIPSDDHALEFVLAHRAAVEALTTVLVPSQESYNQTSDKYLTMQLAEKAGVPHPQTLWPVDAAEVEQLAPNLRYPLVIKPRKSSGSRGIRVVQNAQELCQMYRQIEVEYPRPMLQEFIPAGDRFDVCLLYNRAGELRASFVQKELRHYPVDIGPSTVQESVWMPELVELSVALLQQVPWQGVVEVEFMRDPRDGVPKLMEINPRFWNSLEMAVQAGVDFPYLLCQAALGGDVNAVHQYEVGRICRNLLPSDILHVLANPLRRELNPPFWAKQVRDDIWSRHDPLPTLGFALAVARLLFDRKVWKMMFKR
ncbi:ATP-grasp domain-containing protein [Tumebacillus permanentifrigoris]|uniref:Putative ATP-grasp superfamily ATP-dependent carboligase n=1 Tax=Tumebacillus permanentifrigoris TaxID=378543 RepID=A0A316DDU1_9BACL|nr:ATP-grasp domain-containing protein [Tumebacillus permanentifrigoris]PWK14960.1 putative ATP-grasp superfamily ATP-dependent carboligase [Tumebacillus permanentifrigoris]